MDKRFLRTEALLGTEAMTKLQHSTVTIVGLGAVGGYALEAVVRAGIGNLILVDFDIIDITNINRQILATTSSIGQQKTEVAKKRALDINPNCQIITKELFINQDTLPQLLEIKTDLVIDAIDSLNSKCGLIEGLLEKNIPFISSMGAALKTKPEFIKFGKLNTTKNCGLAKFIRKRLKKRGTDITKINCVYSDEQVILPETAMFLEEGNQRNTLGSLPTITAIFGLTIANQTIKQLLEEK